MSVGQRTFLGTSPNQSRGPAQARSMTYRSWTVVRRNPTNGCHNRQQFENGGHAFRTSPLWVKAQQGGRPPPKQSWHCEPVSRRAVAGSLKRLEKHSYIVSQQQRWRGVQATNRYLFPALVPECKPECNSEDAESQDLSAKQSADLSAIPSARCLHSQEEVVRERISEESPLSGPPQLQAVMQGELRPAEPKRAKRGSALPDDFEVPQQASSVRPPQRYRAAKDFCYSVCAASGTACPAAGAK